MDWDPVVSFSYIVGPLKKMLIMIQARNHSRRLVALPYHYMEVERICSILALFMKRFSLKDQLISRFCQVAEKRVPSKEQILSALKVFKPRREDFASVFCSFIAGRLVILQHETKQQSSTEVVLDAIKDHNEAIKNQTEAIKTETKEIKTLNTTVDSIRQNLEYMKVRDDQRWKLEEHKRKSGSWFFS